MGMYKELGLKKCFKDVEFSHVFVGKREISQSEALRETFEAMVEHTYHRDGYVSPRALKEALTQFLQDLALELNGGEFDDATLALRDRLVAHIRAERKREPLNYSQILLAAVLVVHECTYFEHTVKNF